MKVVTLTLAQQYTEESLKGLGALQGANCTIKSIKPGKNTYGEAGNFIIFEWTANDGTKQESELFVKDGAEQKSFIYEQTNASTTWTITHGLNKQYPEILCIDDSGNTIHGEINYYSANLTIIEFCKAVKGKAIIK